MSLNTTQSWNLLFLSLFFFLISAFIEDDYITLHESPKLGLEDGAQQGVGVSSQQIQFSLFAFR